ncbi:UNVERIFIED_CONTAM: hypothetical protein FKN15_042208 [Acipenser sinensis]
MGNTKIRGFISAISPDGNDHEDLLAFRFSAMNPIVDPWIFIIFRKSVFRNVGSLLCCRFSTLPLKSNTYQDPSKLQSIPCNEQNYSSLQVAPH